jgi:hypothetical protein
MAKYKEGQQVKINRGTVEASIASDRLKQGETVTIRTIYPANAANPFVMYKVQGFDNETGFLCENALTR